MFPGARVSPAEAAAEAAHELQLEQYPPVRSPWLSRWAGLGYGQGQIGSNFLMMAQYDKPEHMRRTLAPMLPPSFKRGASLVASLAPFVFCAMFASSFNSAVPMSDVGLAVLLGALLCFLCCGTLSLLPDPGISLHFRMLDDGVAALHVAAQHGSLGAARMLLAEGAAIELRDRDGRTALHHAAEHMQEDVARFLLERGADIHARDAQNRKPYQLVPERGGVLWVSLGGPATTYEYKAEPPPAATPAPNQTGLPQAVQMQLPTPEPEPEPEPAEAAGCEKAAGVL